jgi:parvulin-like peptidyl-prolyl isomerase
VISLGQGETISEEELRREISHNAMNAGDQVFDTIMHRAVTRVTDGARLHAAAAEKGFMDHQSVLDYVDQVRDSLLLESYLTENVASRIVFNHEEFEKYYQEHLDEFREPDEVRLKALQLADQADAELAVDYLKDGADFGYVTNQLGRDDGIDHDENEWFGLETFPNEVAAELNSLKQGQITNPFQLADGWVIFQLKARRPGEVKTIAEVDGQLREVMFQRHFNELLDNLLSELKASSDIQLYQQAIDEYLGTGS